MVERATERRRIAIAAEPRPRLVEHTREVRIAVELVGKVPNGSHPRPGYRWRPPMETRDCAGGQGVACASVRECHPERSRVRKVRESISLVTLGVVDYARAKAFYEALGWTVRMEEQETAFYQANGVVLVLWSREKLADDSGIADTGARWSGITLAHNVPSRDEVQEVIELARTHGAEITREPADTFYRGYAGVFRDLDGHAWEIAYNPGFVLDEDGSIELPAADA